MRDIVFAAFFTAYLPLILRYPHIGAMVWTWLSFCSPDDYLYGFMTSLPLSKIVAVLTVAALLLRLDGRRPYMDPMMLTMLSFVLVGLVSASVSVTPLPLNWDICGKISKIVVLCFVLTSVVTTRRRLQAVIAAMALGLAFNGADEGLKVLVSGGGHHVVGVTTMGDNNSFATAMLMCLPMLLFLNQTSTNPIARTGFIGALVLCIISIVGTYSRGGFVGLVTFALGLIALNRNKLRNFLLVGAAGAILLLAAPDTWYDRIHSIGNAGQDGSFMERVTAWKVSTLLALDRPFTGGGFHAIQDTAVWQRYGQDLARLDFLPSAPMQARGMAAHSIYFEVLGDLGFFGLLLFVVMLALAIRCCGQIRSRAAPHDDLAWLGGLASMLRLSLIVYMVSGAALSFAYFEGLYLVVALLSVARRMLAEELACRTPVVDASEDASSLDSGWDEFGLGQVT